MTARNTKGLTISVVKSGATPTTETLTAVAAGADTTLSVADTTGMKVGDLIHFPAGSTGWAELDGKWHTIKTVVDTTDITISADTTGNAAATTGTFSHYASATDLQGVCWSELTLSVDEPETVEVGTYCDPTATISSAATAAGTINFAGFVDIKDADYAMLLDMIENQTATAIRINLPNNGYLVAPVTFNSITWDLPLDGAISYSGSATLASKMVHHF